MIARDDIIVILSPIEGIPNEWAKRSQTRVEGSAHQLDTAHENVVVISRRSKALRAEIFRGFSRVELRHNSKSILATLLITDDDSLVGPNELGLAEPAFRRFGGSVGEFITILPAVRPASLDAVRAKIQGGTLSADQIRAIVDDLAHYRYSEMEVAAFLISSASFMTTDELLALTQSMAGVGTQGSRVSRFDSCRGRQVFNGYGSTKWKCLASLHAQVTSFLALYAGLSARTIGRQIAR